MALKNLGIIGGGQLGSMMSSAAKKLDIRTVVYSDDKDAPAQNFCDEFIFGGYDDKQKILEFISKVDVISYEFENIPYETLNEMNKLKPVLPKPSVNRLIQHRIAEKDFVNKLNIRTTRYVSIEKKSDIETLGDFLPGILKTTTMGYDGKGQYPIKTAEDINSLNIDFSKGYILEKLVKLKKEISVIITRYGSNNFEIYDPIENTHQDQILKYSVIPAEISKKILDQSKDWTTTIAEELKISISTVYKTLSNLEELALAEVDKYVITPDGKKIKLYRSRIGKVEITLEDLEPKLHLHPNPLNSKSIS